MRGRFPANPIPRPGVPAIYRTASLQAGGLVVLKLVVLGPLQLACAAACEIEAEAAMSLLLLALCPVVGAAGGRQGGTGASEGEKTARQGRGRPRPADVLRPAGARMKTNE